MKYLLIALLALGACASAPADRAPTLVVAPPTPPRSSLKDRIPTSALECKDEPNGSTVQTSRQVAIYVVSVKQAGRDCRTKLRGAKALIQNEQ